jgi:hypothetical protein
VNRSALEPSFKRALVEREFPPQPEVTVDTCGATSTCALPCKPLPKCAFALFVHVQKTGGTTTRYFLKGQPGYEYYAMAAGPLLPTLQVDAQPPTAGAREPIVAAQGRVQLSEFLLNIESSASVLREHPRVLFEVHGDGSLTSVNAAIARMRAAPAFRAAGCDAFSFVSVREPTQFLVSNLHDSFRHSFYRREFVQRTRPETEYFQPDWHARLADIAAEVPDSQIKTFMRYMQPLRAPASSSAPLRREAVEAALSALEGVDIIGITNRGDELFAQLAVRLGLRKALFEIVGSNSDRVRKAHCAHPTWRADEARLFSAAGNASAIDHELYARGLQLANARIAALPGGRAHLACQHKWLRELNVGNRPLRPSSCPAALVKPVRLRLAKAGRPDPQLLERLHQRQAKRAERAERERLAGTGTGARRLSGGAADDDADDSQSDVLTAIDRWDEVE